MSDLKGDLVAQEVGPLDLDWTSNAGERMRDFRGYGPNPPEFRWPDGARLAINFAVNFEEGTERNPLVGDAHRDSRGWLKSSLPPGERDLMQESEYEYGTRTGIWRLVRMFEKYEVPFSVFVSSQALPVSPELTDYLAQADCDFVSHGVRSISAPRASEAEQRRSIRDSVDEVYRLTGKRILGAFPRPPIREEARRIMAEEGLLYDSATTNDDVPYYADVAGRPMLVVPYAIDTNDARFWGGQTGPGFTGSSDFFDYLRSAFDILYDEADTSARMMSVGLHARIMRPGRVASLRRFLEYVRQFPEVAIMKRNDIATSFAEKFAPENAWNWPSH
ncbi:polysaccharide deacetylase family protein [Pseudactinotalea sp. HY158]|uniref:polysaccharide deacetylase family protein n=1 Tax=Pseudactinotalea sp. HY158 TaxID=2654547 RepID=UPI00129C140E|nr:polysaccharide deacetylase family protein [Pseudactinotalea sp. HY158]QGH68456.1 polysaccharide deacetylase family protein [Pseudactinotalea sp. HY158]